MRAQKIASGFRVVTRPSRIGTQSWLAGSSACSPEISTEPVRFPSGKWYVFKLSEKRLQNENLTLESPNVRPQITQALVNQRKEILNAALLETAVNEAKVVNNLANTMITNPSNLGLRPASSGSVPVISPAATSTPATTASPAAPASSPAATSSPQ